MTDSDAETSETIVWLDFARDCQYISEEAHPHLHTEYELGEMMKNPENFIPK